MQHFGTITSKNQLTLPVKIAQKLNLTAGTKVIFSEEDGKVIITPALKLVEELSGSIPMPEAWKGKDVDELIEEAKDDYFKEKYASFLKSR